MASPIAAPMAPPANAPSAAPRAAPLAWDGATAPTAGATVAASISRSWASQDGDDVEHEILGAIDHAAEQLRNTRVVCRSSYVHPAVLDAHRTGDVRSAWRSARSTTGHSRAERAALALLS